MKKKRQIQGFTLLEMLVTISLLALIATTGTQLLTTILKNSSKARIGQLVKQEGNFAMMAMERTIRNAKSIDISSIPCSSEMTKLALVNYNGDDLAFEFINIGASGYIASEGASIKPITSDAVEVSSGNFECDSGLDNSPAMIKVDFTLKQANSSLRPEETVSIPFHQTISLRNY